MSDKTFIIAVSGGGGECQHIAKGLHWAEAMGATVRFVHVVQTVLVPTGYAVGDVLPMDVRVDDPCRDVDCLRGYVETELGRPLEPDEATFTILRGGDEESLVELSALCECLVLGHHHINGFLHFFTHSVDERIINQARCPVMIVPED
jgi:nucleotide-binding universal stress UspA family protein